MFFSTCAPLALLACVAMQHVPATGSASSVSTLSSLFPPSDASKFNIAIPYSLHKDVGDSAGYIHNIGRFGSTRQSPYGAKMGINMYYVEDSLCHYPVHNNNNNNSTVVVVGSDWVSPFVLMTTKRNKNGTAAGAKPRDDCTITTKTRHAQMMGASGLVISDNRCVCGDSACNSTTAATTSAPLPCEPYLPLVIEDGSAGDVTIPAILLLKSDGDAIISYMKKHAKTPVIVDLAWHPTKMVGKRPGPVSFEFVMDPLDVNTQSLLRNFKPMAEALQMGNWQLNNRTLFTPHYALIDGTLAHCPGNDGEGQDCANMCTNGGRYCYPAYKAPAGKMVVTEILRRTCIWKHHHNKATTVTTSRLLQDEIYPEDKKEEEIEEKDDEAHNEDRKDILGSHVWWDYVTYFDGHCGNGFDIEGENSFGTPDCIQKAYDYAAIKSSDIEECMQDSGDPNKDQINTLLQSHIDYSTEHGINGQVPAVIVNNERINDDVWNEQLQHDFSDSISSHAAGLVGAKVALFSICKQFDSTAPDVCTYCGGSEKENSKDVALLTCVRKYVTRRNPDGSKKKNKKSRALLWLFIISLVGGGAFYVYKKREDVSGFQISDSMARFRYSLLPSRNNDSNNAPLNEALGSS